MAEQRRRRDAEELIPTIKVHIKELEDAGLDEEDENMVEARNALAKAQRDARRRVVDLGCGAGRDFPAFEERNIDYLGVDASEGMLTVARERFPEATFEAQDLCALDLPERSFDGAFANASLQQCRRRPWRTRSQTSTRASAGRSPFPRRRQGRRGWSQASQKKRASAWRSRTAENVAGASFGQLPCRRPSYGARASRCLSGGGPLTTTPASKT